MPIEGYASITVSDELYEKLKNLAESTHRSIAKLIEYLLEQFNQKPINLQESDLEVPA